MTSDKCHLLISSNETTTVNVDEYETENNECEKLISIKLDWKLNVADPISDICMVFHQVKTAFVKDSYL